MFLLPVKAVPAVPAPAPAAAPMSAPLPPPARPPIRAPRPAPPPIKPSERRPLPFSTREMLLVMTGKLCPCTSMRSRRIARTAPPLKRPSGFASSTAPSARAPRGTTTLPLESVIAFSTVALKVSPLWLIFEPRSWLMRTRISRPAGITCAGGGEGARRARAGREL
ncbi:MAG TPA: hypothetical protein DGA22_09345 [Acidobacterium sp.]|nr:hypothetical protein [Acidobacterium sp.]